MSLWWLQPGWKSTTCQCCGANIWNSGGDPDWGECYECFGMNSSQEYPEEPFPDSPPCEICGKNEAVTGENGWGVCSEECADEARKKEATNHA